MPASRAGRLRIRRGDARRLEGIDDRSVQLVVTSPPYPMIPQWDATFRAQGAHDYAGMHAVLDPAWAEAHRVLVDGGMLAVIVGDALRTHDGEFRLWPNHARVIEGASRLGFSPLPYILWKKPTNKPNAYLGSGFLPPNAYVTLDCEFILLFRKGRLRSFPPRDAARYRSRFSREERDRWFSQIWTDIRGVRQVAAGRRTGAFPAEIPARLVRMFSVEGETVLDPFAGTGTTLWEALALGRRAQGVEWDPGIFAELEAEARQRGLSAPPARVPRPMASRARGARSPR